MKQLYRRLEALLNNLTMYRLILYVLLVIAGAAFGLSLTGHLGFTPLELARSLGILVSISFATSQLCAYTFSVKTNFESGIITSLILFLIVLPPNDLKGYVSLGMIGFIAMASKYFLAWRGRHIFNPAAIAVVIAGFAGFGHAGWWVATPLLLPTIAVGGSLVVWKIRHAGMVSVFLGTGLLVTIWVAILNHQAVLPTLQTAITSFPLLFLATIMLTEPQTAPTTRRWQYAYATLVGVLAHAGFAWWLSPELALCIGNLLAFAVSPHRRIWFHVESVYRLAARTYEIIIRPTTPLAFQPGQYLELSLPHLHADSHGTRRMFSIASTPHEGVVRFGITHSENISSFKRALIGLKPGSVLTANHLGGDFVLDKSNRPLIFLAGGIGITPFRALLQQLVETQSQRSVTLFYSARTPEALVWSDYLQAASQSIPLQLIPIVSEPTNDWHGETGHLNGEVLARYAPNVREAIVYISGPPAFVHAAKGLARQSGVLAEHTKTDYFSGY